MPEHCYRKKKRHFEVNTHVHMNFHLLKTDLQGHTGYLPSSLERTKWRNIENTPLGAFYSLLSPPLKQKLASQDEAKLLVFM